MAGVFSVHLVLATTFLFLPRVHASLRPRCFLLFRRFCPHFRPSFWTARTHGHHKKSLEDTVESTHRRFPRVHLSSSKNHGSVNNGGHQCRERRRMWLLTGKGVVAAQAHSRRLARACVRAWVCAYVWLCVCA